MTTEYWPATPAEPGLLASIHILDTVPLVLENAWKVEPLPASVLALVLIRRRSRLRIADIADSIEVKIGLISVSR